jgi:4-carboxymuconolactone decarboxylase
MRNVSMPPSEPRPLASPLDASTRALVVLAAHVAGSGEIDMRAAVVDAVRDCPSIWVEELILQTYLFAGFPRALNAAREWRRAAPGVALPAKEPATEPEVWTPEWRTRGEATCATVYGDAYTRLRHNIAALHPALDTWMIVEGYGKVLSRPGLDLARRELCIVAACAHTGQDRQLHSHLHGALNAGAPAEVLDSTFDALEPVLEPESMRTSRMLWARVRSQRAA